MGGGGGTPAVPDYVGAAQATARGSQQATTAQNYSNRPTVNSPTGSQSWTTGTAIDPATGQNVTTWQQNNTLSPQLQSALDTQMGITAQRSNIAQGLLGGLPTSGPDYSGISPLSGKVQGGQLQRSISTQGVNPMQKSGQDYAQGAEDQLYAGYKRRFDDQFGRQNKAAETQMINQGLSPNSTAWSASGRDRAYAQNDAYQGAATQAQQGAQALAQQNFQQDLSTNQNQFVQNAQQATFGNTAQGQDFNQQLQGGQFQNATSAQQLAQMLQQRGYGVNEINSLLSGAQVQMPTFTNTGGAGCFHGAQLLGRGGEFGPRHAHPVQRGAGAAAAAESGLRYGSAGDCHGDVRRAVEARSTPRGHHPPWSASVQLPLCRRRRAAVHRGYRTASAQAHTERGAPPRQRLLDG